MLSIKLARVKKGLTQKQLAQLVGVSSSTINRIETGKQILKVDILNKIVNVLGITHNDILDKNVLLEETRWHIKN